MTRTEELKKYIESQGIRHDVNKNTGVWFVAFADMTQAQKNYIMSASFAECGFAGWMGISF
jgi:hypothetical protein